MTVTDGPFIILEVADIDEALAIASEWPSRDFPVGAVTLQAVHIRD